MNHTKEKKIIIIIFNIILLVAGIRLMHSTGQEIILQGDELTNYAGYCNANANSLYIDDTIDFAGESFMAKELTLPKGIYQIKVSYVTDHKENFISVSSQEAGFTGLYADASYMIPYEEAVTFKIWVNRNISDANISINYNGDGYLEVNEIMVTPLPNTAGMLQWIFMMLILDAILYLYWRHKEKTLEQNHIMTVFVIGITVLIASLPLAETYLLEGHDLMFHLIRIEGVKEGLLAGQFPVIVQPNWLHGYGYDVSVFYSDFFLYFPAILSMLSVPIQDCYKIYIITMNLLTAGIAYFSFKKVSNNNRYAGYLGCVLYTLSIYRILCIYKRAAVGELTAMTVLPLLIYAFWYIYTKDTDEKKYKYGWILPVISFSALIQSHLLTCQMAGLFTVIVCLVKWKKTFSKKTFVVLLKIVVFTVLLNVGYVIPFLIYSQLGLCVFYDWGGVYSIQESGAQLANMLSVFPGPGKAYGPGIALLTGTFVFVILGIRRYGTDKISNQDKQVLKIGTFFTVIGLLALWMSSNFFPYDWFMNWGAFYEFMTKLQFPFRYLTIAVPFLTGTSCIAFLMVLQKYGKNMALGFVVLLLAGVMITDTNYYTYKMVNDPSKVIVYDAVGLDTEYIEGHEYMYANVDMGNFEAGTVEKDDAIQLTTYEKVYSNVTMSCMNESAEDAYITLPMFMWPGFEAVNLDTGEYMTIENTEDMLMKVKIPAGFEGNIYVGFQMPRSFRIAQVASLVILISLFIYVILSHRRDKKRIE